MRTKNGNGANNLLLLHWNMGSKFWVRKKLEIEATLQRYKPQIMIISEANLLLNLTEQERNIPGYKILTPTVPADHKIVRIVALVEETLECKLIPEYMNPSIASIWLKVTNKGKKPLVVGGYYRQHQYILMEEENDSNTDQKQLERLSKFVQVWTRAARKYEVAVIGDLNLDFARWASPEQNKERMTDLIKNEIETSGFFQMVTGMTRTWPGQPDSQIDHLWMNFPQKLVSIKNIPCASSDHNLILASITKKLKSTDRHNFICRDRRNLDPAIYKSEIEKIDWSDLLESEKTLTS